MNDVPTVMALNKADLLQLRPGRPKSEDGRMEFLDPSGRLDRTRPSISALTGDGIGDLLEMIESQLGQSDAFVGQAYLASARA